jgi:hypothetical protein
MAVTDTRATFLDFQKKMDPDGKNLLPIAEVLNQVNAPLQDGEITPSNAPLGHRVTMRTSFPVVSTGKVNQGIARSKGTTEQRNESMALFVGRSETDRKLIKKMGEENYRMHRAGEDIAFSEAFSQYVARQFAYGSVSNDEATFDGVSTRMPNLNQPPPGQNGSQVWSMGAVSGGDGSSIYVTDWNPDRGVHWIYPEASKSGGLTVENHEYVPLNDVDNNQFFGDVSEYEWNIGLAVEDPRRIARLANIDISDANLGNAATQGQLIDSLIDIFSYMPSKMGFNRVMYCHSRLFAAFHKQAIHAKTTVLISMNEYLGEMIPHFDGVPIRRLDQASIAESTVT